MLAQPTDDWHDLARRWDHTAALASRLAHDLANIFTGVNGFAELALLQLGPDHSVRNYLNDLVSAGRRGIDLAQRLHLLRTCSTAETGTAPIGLAMSMAETRLRPEIPPGLSITTNLPPDLPQVRMTIEPLHQVFFQLMHNAAEASGPGGVVRVDARVIDVDEFAAARLAGQVSPGEHVEICITDSGPGLVSDFSYRLLEAPMLTTRSGCRGLGLAIVFRTLYARHGGFELTNSGGGGTLARVVLPVA